MPPTPLVTCRRSRRSSARMHLLRAVVPAMLVAFLGAASAAAAQGEFPDEWFFSGADRPEALRALEGKPAPELDLAEWIGDETTLAKLRGKVVVVDFWATWCGPCMAAIPKNVEMIERHRDEGFAFIGVHDSRNGWDRAAAVVNDKSINYPVALDGGESVKRYGLSFWPTYVVVDRKGTIRAAGLTPDKVSAVVEVLLAEPVPAGIGGGASSEFEPTWYEGGDARPSALRAREGVAAPPLSASEWIGDPVEPDARAGRVVVLHFLAPWDRRTRERFTAWCESARALAADGVLVIGVADHGSDRESLASLVGEDVAFPVMLDEAPAADAKLPLGRTWSAYGIRFWPTTVVIDRAGRVRAAGLRPARVDEVVRTLLSERVEEPTPTE